MIYQDLADLKAACAALSPRDPATQEFEVGVFCGKYITPVDDSYFEHLERARGLRRKSKPAASTTVAHTRDDGSNGAASEPDGVESGGFLPVNGDLQPQLNGVSIAEDEHRDLDALDKQARVGESQDISLHNLNDHPL